MSWYTCAQMSLGFVDRVMGDTYLLFYQRKSNYFSKGLSEIKYPQTCMTISTALYLCQILVLSDFVIFAVLVCVQ